MYPAPCDSDLPTSNFLADPIVRHDNIIFLGLLYHGKYSEKRCAEGNDSVISRIIVRIISWGIFQCEQMNG